MKLLYLSPVRWGSYYQRPHYMVEYFLKLSSKNTVLWVDPYPTRLPCIGDVLRKKSAYHQKTILPDGLTVCSLASLPIEPLKYSEVVNNFFCWKKAKNIIRHFFEGVSDKQKLIGIGKPSKFALSILGQYPNIRSFYDAMDDFPEFYTGISRHSMQVVEEKLAAKVSCIIVSSSYLLHKFPGGIKILNGYPMSSLPAVETVLKESNPSPKIFGYIGTVGKWFDWALVVRLAHLFSKDIIRIIGPEYIQRPLNLPHNIEFYPACSQSAAVEHLKNFHVGLIPFRKNALTQSVDPIKYYEYRAMNLPVVSSQFGEMCNKENIIYFEEPDSVILEKLKQKNSAADTLHFRKQHDWSARFILLDFLFSHD